MSRTYTLTPADAWFFRTSRPFERGEGGQSDAGSVFPPTPNTVVGALRAGFARTLGWHFGGTWNPACEQALGTGEDLGPLRFNGPWLTSSEGKELALWFPAPLDLVGTIRREGQTEAFEPWTRLAPGDPVECDLGTVRLPAPLHAIARGKTAEGYWIHRDGMEAMRAGALPKPEHLRHASELWESEHRVGLARDNNRRAAIEGQLYSTRHIRLRAGVSLTATVHGWHGDSPTVLPMGGESRLACCTTLEQPPRWPAAPTALPREDTWFTLTLITPARLEPSALKAGASLADLLASQTPDRERFRDCTLMTVCTSRPARIGGWATTAKGVHGPRPLRSHVPAGTVLFLTRGTASADDRAALDRAQLGVDGEWGYGEVLVGLQATRETIQR